MAYPTKRSTTRTNSIVTTDQPPFERGVRFPDVTVKAPRRIWLSPQGNGYYAVDPYPAASEEKAEVATATVGSRSVVGKKL
jgi:hypothetical protein